MEKDVIISIKGVQRYENAEEDTLELVTEGRLERDGIAVEAYFHT